MANTKVFDVETWEHFDCSGVGRSSRDRTWHFHRQNGKGRECAGCILAEHGHRMLDRKGIVGGMRGRLTLTSIPFEIMLRRLFKYLYCYIVMCCPWVSLLWRDHQTRQIGRSQRTCLTGAHSASLSNLFILDTFEETLRSIVRSPISTTSPPTMSGFT